MSSLSVVDVCVIGAGPAGTAAAATLAKNGVETVVVDKATFPRDKSCGDALTTMSLRSLAALGLAPDVVASWTPVNGAVVHPPRGAPVTLDLPGDDGGYAAIARRTELDAALVDLAQRSGAEVRTGAHVTKRWVGADWIDVAFSDGSTLRCRHVVVATGAGALQRGEADMHATRLYMTAPGGAPDRVHVVFAEHLLPGYAWVFPIGASEVNVGVAVQNSHHTAREAVAATRAFVRSGQFRHIAGDVTSPTDRVRSWPIPSSLLPSPSVQRTLYVGDAAGLADPMTGEGLGQALRSGILAARAITLAGNRDAAPGYRRNILRNFAGDHAASRLCLRALSHPRSAAAAVRFMGSTSKRARYFARWMWEETPRSAVISPVALVRSLRTGHRVTFPS